MVPVPPPPITDHRVALPPRVNGNGLNVNAWRRQPGATVLHSMGGSLKGTDGYFQGARCPALTDYGIGQTDHGAGYAEIIQWTDIFGFVEPWASGPVVAPEGDGPRWLDHIGGAGKVNEVGVSIEHDDSTQANGRIGAIGAEPVTAYQWAATVWLQAWLHAEIFHQTDATFDWNLYHYELCGHAYKTCPNPRITNYTAEHQAAVKAVMAHFQRGRPYPPGGVAVAGLRIAVPRQGVEVEGKDVREPKPGTAMAYVNERGEAIHVWNAGGTAVIVEGSDAQDVGMVVRNDKRERYGVSLQGNVQQPWVLLPPAGREGATE